MLLNWVLKYKGWPGAVTRAFNTTKMLDRIAQKYGRELIEHGIGFKYVVDLMLEREIVMGGEESGGIGFQRHLPERDGLLNCLMLANVMAQEKKDAGPTRRRRPGRVRRAPVRPHRSAHLPKRRRTPPSPAPTPSSLATRSSPAWPSTRQENLDGVKFYLDNPEAKTKPKAAETWLLLRASGTEPCCASTPNPAPKESVAKLLDSARKFALG